MITTTQRTYLKMSLAAVSLALCSLTAHAATYIHAGKVIPANSNKVLSNMTIVVDGNTISKVERGYQQPGQNDQLVDLRDYTLMPGLMDMHVHLSFLNRGPASYIEPFRLNEADYTLKGVVYANDTLQAGFTTVRNVGDRYNETIALRNAINKGMIPGPRIYSSGQSIATTGGHADPTNGRSANISGDPGPKQGVVNGVAEARKAVRQRYKDGADLIKITGTGGVLSVAKSGQNPQFMQDEVDAIVQTAKDYGMTVAVHAHGKEGMKRAIKAGVDSIEHGTLMDKSVIKLMKKHGTYLVPTIMAGNWVAEKAKIDGFFPELVRPKAASIGIKSKDTFSRAYKAGVKIAYGTDSGVSRHGHNGREFANMVDAGMQPIDAIRSATWNTADLLKIQDKLGSIEAGKLADMVAVKGDPLQNISLMENISWIMKDGVIYKQPEQD